MKSAIDRSILSNRRKSENCKENSQSLSHRAKILKEQVPIKKSKQEKTKQMNRSPNSSSKFHKKSLSSALARSFYDSKCIVDDHKSESRLSNSYSNIQLTEEQRKVINSKKFTPSKISFDLQSNQNNSITDLKSFGKIHCNTADKSHNDLKFSMKSKKENGGLHKRRGSQYTAKCATKPLNCKLTTITESVLSKRKKSVKGFISSTIQSFKPSDKRCKPQMFSKKNNIKPRPVSELKRSTGLDKAVESCRLQEKLDLFEEILYNQYESNCNKYKFVDFLDILQALNLISKNVSTSQEKELLSQCWHLVSFYLSGDIVSSFDNIKVFIYGILGCNEEWLFKSKKMSRSSNEGKVFDRASLREFLNNTNHIMTGENNDYKIFKFTSKQQIAQLRNEFEELDISISEMEDQSEGLLDNDQRGGDDLSLSTSFNNSITNANNINSNLLKDSMASAIIDEDEQETKGTFNSGSKESVHSRDDPVLDLDIYISEGHIEKLYVYKDDSPTHIVDEFSKKYNLIKEKRDVLVQVVKSQIDKVLTCISEEEEETE